MSQTPESTQLKMKKILLLATTVLLWTCFVNAQTIRRDTAAMKRFQPQRPQGKDTAFHKFMPQRPGGQRGFQPFAGNGQRGGRMNQQRGGRMMQGRDMVRGMMQRPRLSQAQQEQAKTINENYRKQLQTLQKNDALTMGAYKSQMAAFQKERKTKMEAIYTPEQKKQMEDQKKRAEINARVNSVARLERMKLTLGLSDDQVSKIKANEKDFRDKMKAIRENDALLPQQKAEQLKELAGKQKNVIGSVLTDDQKAKMKNNMQRGGGGRGGFPSFRGMRPQGGQVPKTA